MEPVMWLILSPLILVFPGLFPARLITGRLVCGWTFAWAFFFSVTLLPPLCFGLAMLFGTVMGLRLVFPVAIVLGGIGLVFPKNNGSTDADTGNH